MGCFTSVVSIKHNTAIFPKDFKVPFSLKVGLDGLTGVQTQSYWLILAFSKTAHTSFTSNVRDILVQHSNI